MSRPKTALITTGPTREPIDPIRFISNPSTGKMGLELAREARRRGWKAILISGPTNLVPPKDIKFVPIVTAKDMMREVMRFLSSADCLIMAAAVGDFRPKRPKLRKIKRGGTLTLELARTPDILARVGRLKGKRIVVGFALETENLIENARRKLKAKNLDLIVANRVGNDGAPFGERKISCVMLGRDGSIETFEEVTKREIARALFGRIGGLLTFKKVRAKL